MKSRLVALISLAVGILIAISPAFAHHGTATYEPKTETVSGIVTDFEFVNPHVLLGWEVKDEKGDIQKWMGEIGGPNSLARSAGWTTKTIKPGDQVTVTGNRSKNGSPTMRIVRIVLNGKELKMGGGDN